MKKLISKCLCLVMALALTMGMGAAALAEDDFEAVTAVDNEECAITIKSIDPDDMWGYTLKALLENKSLDKTYTFVVETAFINGVDGASVNGFMLEPYYGHELMPGKCCFDEMTWSDADLEDNEIEAMEEIEFTLWVHDSDDWMADDIFNEVLTLTP